MLLSPETLLLQWVHGRKRFPSCQDLFEISESMRVQLMISFQSMSLFGAWVVERSTWEGTQLNRLIEKMSDPVAIWRMQRIGNDPNEAIGEIQGNMRELDGRAGSGEGRMGERM
jgi:hypothetical protein